PGHCPERLEPNPGAGTEEERVGRPGHHRTPARTFGPRKRGGNTLTTRTGMKSSDELKKEITALEERRAAIARTLEDAWAKLDAARERIIAGDADAPQMTVAVQAEITAHSGTVEALSRRLETLHMALQDAEAAE